MDKIQTIAMYLPQFHRVKENDEWWGEGYTDWVAVKKAEKLFKDHYQPREPLHDNYYDLLEKKTLEEQAVLMKKYGVDGLCFYHYYFKDGRKILEKPAENLLEWKDIPMSFCFCWDSTQWAKTWSKFAESAIWIEKFEQNSNKDDNGILLEQRFGREKEWKEHFEYLLPFFKDERYVRVENKPVFLFYRPQKIVCLAEMTAYWNQLAKENGLEGIYTIGMNMPVKKNGLDAMLICGPNMYWNSDYFGDSTQIGEEAGVRYFEYEELWKNAMDAAKINGIKTYFGGFVDYDTTPRQGKNGLFLKNVSVETFRKYWYRLVKKNIRYGNEIAFINAFNEWGEGNYLEPDKNREYDFLEAVADVKAKIENEDIQRIDVKADSGIVSTEKDMTEEVLKKRLEKYKNYFNLLVRWLELKENNISVSTYLMQYGYRRIAIYGFGVLGKHLYAELKDSKTEVAYAIDRKVMAHPEIEIKEPEEKLPEVDAIVITATFEFDEIYPLLKERMDCPIISLEEVLQECN